MTELNPLPHDMLVLAADARKARFLRNAGAGLRVDLVAEREVEAPPNPRTSDQGTDRPGKTAYRGRSSAMEETDWARRAEAKFAREVAALLAKQVRKGGVEAIALIAPPAFMGDLRNSLTKPVKALVVREITKDFAHADIADIERALAGK